MELRTKIVSAVIRSLKLPPRFRLKIVKEDPVRLELSLTPSYGKNPVIVGIVESLDLVARRDREGRLPRDLQGTWDWTVRHGKVSTGGWNPMLKEALQTMFDTGLPAIVYEELTGDEYRPAGRYSSPVNSSYTIAGKPVSNIVCNASFNIGFQPPVLTFPCLTVQSQVP